MLHRKEFLETHGDVRTGMTAYASGGAKVGVIERIDDDGITIEKGRIFHKEVRVPYDDIEEVRQDNVIIRERREGAERERREKPVETREPARPEAKGKEPEPRRAEEQARVPVREEEREARKREKESEVRAQKEVRTETARGQAPIQKEEVHVEPVPPSEARAGGTGENTFREQDVRIPGKEEVEVKEETSGEVRKEDVKVDRTKTSPKE